MRRDDMAEDGGKVANWRIVLAAILDFIAAFFVFGFLVGHFSGELTGAPGGSVGGFSLSGWSALILLVLIVLYLIIGNRIGGTFWKRILGLPARR